MLAWLKKLVGAAAPTSPAPAPSEPDAPYRVEETTREGCTERRRYNRHTGPEWLEELLETAADATGQSFRRRTWYYPWGPVRWQLTQQGDELTLLAYFANGELKLRKQVTAGRLTDYFRWAPPGGSYTYTEEMPQYPGGDRHQLIQDVQKAFRYPTQALRNGEQGRLVLGFVVSETGLVEDIKVVESVSPSLDEAGRQAVATVGARRWRPGMQNQRAVRVAFTMPITCRVQ